MGAEQCQLCGVDAGERRRVGAASPPLVFIFCFPSASAKAAVRLACSDSHNENKLWSCETGRRDDDGRCLFCFKPGHFKPLQGRKNSCSNIEQMLAHRSS